MDGEYGLPRSAQRALFALERVWAVAERAVRRQSGPRAVPVGPIVRIGVERVFQRAFPKATTRLLLLRYAAQEVVPWIGRSPTVARLLQRELAARPERTLAALARLEAIVRRTRPVHRGEWRLRFDAVELRSLTFEGASSRWLDDATFHGSSLEDVRFFGALDDASFERATLRDVSFVGCSLRRACFRAAALEDVVIASGEASRCSFEDADVSHCTFSDVRFASSAFGGAMVRQTVFERCDLAEVDVDDASWEDVDFVDCRNLDAAFVATDGVNVTATTSDARPQRRALGATPRSLMRSVSAAAPALTVRYARAGTRSPPPLGYRLQTLARQVTIWVSLGSGYRRAQREWASHPVSEYAEVLPRSRAIAALQTLMGTDTGVSVLAIAGPGYRAAIEAVQKRHPSLELEAFPALVLVDGDFPVANYVDLGGERYIVMSDGLVGMTIRLARYCIAWVCPPAISYMDRWPEAGARSTQDALAEALAEFARSGGDISGLGRLQVTGMRDLQANWLQMTFLLFVLGHELAHFLQSTGVLSGADSPFELETAADVQAARLLEGDAELDGDAMLMDALRDIDPTFARRAIRQATASARPGEVEPEVVEAVEALLEDDDFEWRGEEFADAVDRFASCDWHAAAVAAFILALGGSAGYHGANDLQARISTVIRAAFGERVLADVLREMASEETALGMLRGAFSPDGAAA
jgi:uncharacterized protein YjbI with pentapeptide repeats